MKSITSLTVKRRLTLGFGMIVAIMLAVSLYTLLNLKSIQRIETRLLDLRVPTVLAGARLENGINLSLAGLRGYMILGKVPEKAKAMKKSRLAGWKELDGAMDEMREFSRSWTNPANIKKLREIEDYVEEFRVAQQEIEDIAHTADEVPAFNTLLNQAVPRSSKIIDALTLMIDEEATLQATAQRKTLLKLLADSRGSFAIGLANIRAYLLSGDSKFSDVFDAKWQVNEARFRQISSMTDIMTSTQARAWTEYSNVRAEFIIYPPLMFTQRSSPDWNLANYWLGTKAAPKAKAIMDIIEGMRINQNKLKVIDIEMLDQEIFNLQIAVLFCGIISLIVGILVTHFISNSVTRPLSLIVTRAKEIANGDLMGNKIEPKGNDELTELTHAMNDMHASLRDIIQGVSNSAGELSSSALQLQNSALQTSQGMESQQNETEQVAAAMNEMSATVLEVSRNASLAAKSASEADKASAQGYSLVSQNMDGINQLARSIGTTSQAINKLGEDTNSVDNIVAVISEIADQTNLLALNAAIEAARAGEQGRGFAVVADEVRTLASRTQKSTEEIRTMLDQLKTGAKDAVQAMDEGQAQAQNSVEQAKNASDAITEISHVVTKINEMNALIAIASEEQRIVTEEMNRNVVRIDSQSHSTLQNSRETTEAAHTINALSSQMQQMVSRFKI
jgi:methyl-accepting chemotaxis protein